MRTKSDSTLSTKSLDYDTNKLDEQLYYYILHLTHSLNLYQLGTISSNTS
jgi:hypothetical protein